MTPPAPNSKKILQYVATFGARVAAFIQVHPYAITLFTILLCAVLLVARRPETIIHAQFWAEDGPSWYTGAYNHGLGTLLEPYAGYIVVVYRLVAFLSLALPFHLAPIFFNVVALGFQLLPIVLLCSGRLRFINKRWIGVILSILYVSVPNAAEVFTNLTNIQWHLGVAAFLVLLAAPSTRIGWRIYDYGVIIATGLSGPLVIILEPIAFFIWRKHRSIHHRNRFFILGALALIQIISIFILSGENRVTGSLDPSITAFIQTITGQIFGGGLLGQAHVDIAYGSSLLLFWLFVGCITLSIYAAIKGPEWLRLANIYSALLIMAMLASLKPVPGFDIWQGLANPGGAQRYWYIPILVWIASLLWIGFKAPLKPLRGIALTGLGLLCLVGIPTDWHIPPKPNQNFREYAVQFEHAAPGTVMHIPVNPGWEMVITKK